MTAMLGRIGIQKFLIKNKRRRPGDELYNEDDEKRDDDVQDGVKISA